MATGRPEPKPRRIAILAVTDGGHKLAASIAKALPNAAVIVERTGLAQRLSSLWLEYDGFVCIMAAGIVARLIAPLLKGKKTDPCVVVLDEAGRFGVSLLSGHLGGGNKLADQIAAITGGQAVITTASDISGHTALDLWARQQDLVAEDDRLLTQASARLVNHGSLRLHAEVTVHSLPEDFILANGPDDADCIVSARLGGWPKNMLLLRPRNLVVGIGCNRGTGREQIEAAFNEALANNNMSELAVRNLASIDLKNDEEGLLAFAESQGLAIDFYGKEQLNAIAGVSWSEAVLRATGAVGVAEPAALCSAGGDNLIVRKMKCKDVTIAIARAPFTLSAPAPEA